MTKRAVYILYSINHSSTNIAVVQLNSGQYKMAPHLFGKIENTGQQLDLAIDGHGYFVFATNDGFVYSREGKFSISERGYIVNEQGLTLALKDGGGPPLPYLSDEKLKKYTQIVISRFGEISLKNPDSGDLIEYDRIVLASIYPTHLRYSGDLYTTTDSKAVDYFSPGENSDDGVILQGAIEIHQYTSQGYLAYIGELEGSSAKLNDSRDLLFNSGWTQISFNSEVTATISNTCSKETNIFCAANVEKNSQLTKVF